MDCHVFQQKTVASRVFVCATPDLILAGLHVTHTCTKDERLRYRNGAWQWERSSDDWVSVSQAPFDWVATFTATDQIDENFAGVELFATDTEVADTDWVLTTPEDGVVEHIMRKLQSTEIPNSDAVCFDVNELLGQPVQSPTWTFIDRIVTETPGVDNFTREFDGRTLKITISTGGKTKRIEIGVA